MVCYIITGLLLYSYLQNRVVLPTVNVHIPCTFYSFNKSAYIILFIEVIFGTT